MKSEMSRYHYRLRPAIAYAKEQGKPVDEMTEKEWLLFRGEKKTVAERCWSMNREAPCVICGTLTGQVEKALTVHVCKPSCMDELDNRQDEGEVFLPNEETRRILEQVERDLFE